MKLLRAYINKNIGECLGIFEIYLGYRRMFVKPCISPFSYDRKTLVQLRDFSIFSTVSPTKTFIITNSISATKPPETLQSYYFFFFVFHFNGKELSKREEKYYLVKWLAEFERSTSNIHRYVFHFTHWEFSSKISTDNISFHNFN